MANFRTTSRYFNGTVSKNRSGQNFLVLRQPLNLEPANGDIFVIVTADLLYRPDLISYKAYGTSDYWWAIYEFNQIRDPFFDLKLGSILRIPELSRVLAAIDQLGTS